MSTELLDALRAARRAEKEQSLFYRALAAQAEDAGDLDAAERLSALHADEQHHFARLSARMMELGEDPPDLHGAGAPPAALTGWEPAARAREQAEIERYERILALELDHATHALLAGILHVERRHHDNLGGKWTEA